MADIGDARNALIQAQNVKLLVASASGSSATINDELVLMRKVRTEVFFPETRTNHGKTRTYNYSAPDLSINFMCSGSVDILPYLTARNAQNANGVLPEYKWAMHLTSNNGAVRVLDVIGTLPYLATDKEDVEQGEPITVEARIRVTGTGVTITDPSV